MGTSSTIQINDKATETTVIIYKHWDGYPSDNLKMFSEAFKRSNNVNEFLENCAKYYNNDFDKDYVKGKYHKDRTVESMLEYTGQYQETLPSEHEEHWDLEYHYVIDFDSKNIDIYGGFGTESQLRSKGKINPYKEVESYVDDYQLPCKKRIQLLLLDLGYNTITINK